MLGRVFGEDVLAALRDGFLKGDLTSVVPLLAAATAKPHLHTALQETFAGACDAGEADVVALLLECNGVDSNAAVDPRYVRPQKNDEYWQYSCSDIALMNDEDDAAGDTALTRATRRGRSAVVRTLVQSGKVDVNRPGPNGGLPLVLAVRSGDTACVELLLLVNGIDANAAADSNYGVQYGETDVEEEDACDDARGDTVLVRAVRHGNAGAVRALVASGKADVNKAAPNGALPLVRAITLKDAACVEALLAADGINTATPERGLVRRYGQSGSATTGATALIAAARAGNRALLQRLLHRHTGVAVNHRQHAADGAVTALTAAVFNGHAGCVRALLQVDGIDVRAADEYAGATLFRTIMDRKGDWEACARALISANSIVRLNLLNCRHRECGWTALHMICETKNASLAEDLLIAGSCRFAPTLALTAVTWHAWHDARQWWSSGVIKNNRNEKYDLILGLFKKGGDTALAVAAGDAAITRLFASGVDYWQRRLHGRHGWAMKEVVRTLLLVDQRLDANAALLAPHMPAALPYLPKEIWLVALGFLRSADFMASAAANDSAHTQHVQRKLEKDAQEQKEMNFYGSLMAKGRKGCVSRKNKYTK